MTSPAGDMITKIAAAGVGFTLGSNMFEGYDRPTDEYIPVNALFVRGGGGPAPDRVMGLSKEERTAVVHLRMRWNRFEEGDAKIRSVMEALQGTTISGYQDVDPVQSEPIPLPPTEERHVMWLLSYRMRYEDAR